MRVIAMFSVILGMTKPYKLYGLERNFTNQLNTISTSYPCCTSDSVGGRSLSQPYYPD